MEAVSPLHDYGGFIIALAQAGLLVCTALLVVWTLLLILDPPSRAEYARPFKWFSLAVIAAWFIVIIAYYPH